MYQIHEYTDGLRRIPNKDGTWTEHPTVQIETDVPGWTVVRSSTFLDTKTLYPPPFGARSVDSIASIALSKM